MERNGCFRLESQILQLKVDSFPKKKVPTYHPTKQFFNCNTLDKKIIYVYLEFVPVCPLTTPRLPGLYIPGLQSFYLFSSFAP